MGIILVTVGTSRYSRISHGGLTHSRSGLKKQNDCDVASAQRSPRLNQHSPDDHFLGYESPTVQRSRLNHSKETFGVKKGRANDRHASKRHRETGKAG